MSYNFNNATYLIIFFKFYENNVNYFFISLCNIFRYGQKSDSKSKVRSCTSAYVVLTELIHKVSVTFLSIRNSYKSRLAKL